MGWLKKNKVVVSRGSYLINSEFVPIAQEITKQAVQQYIFDNGRTLIHGAQRSISDYLLAAKKVGVKTQWDNLLQEVNTKDTWWEWRQQWDSFTRQYSHLHSSNYANSYTLNNAAKKHYHCYDLTEALKKYVYEKEGTQDIRFYCLHHGAPLFTEHFLKLMRDHWGYDRDTGRLHNIQHSSPVYYRGLSQSRIWDDPNSGRSMALAQEYSGFDVLDDGNFVHEDIPSILPHHPRTNHYQQVAIHIFVEEYSAAHGRVVKKEMTLIMGYNNTGEPLDSYDVSTFKHPNELTNNLPFTRTAGIKNTYTKDPDYWITLCYVVRGEYKLTIENVQQLQNHPDIRKHLKQYTVENLQYPIIPLRIDNVDMDSSDTDWSGAKQFYAMAIRKLGYEPKEFMDLMRRGIGEDWGKIDDMVLHLAVPYLNLNNFILPPAVRKYHYLFARFMDNHTFYQRMQGNYHFFNKGISPNTPPYTPAFFSHNMAYMSFNPLWVYTYVLPPKYVGLGWRSHRYMVSSSGDAGIKRVHWGDVVRDTHIQVQHPYGAVEVRVVDGEQYGKNPIPTVSMFGRGALYDLRANGHELDQYSMPLLIPLLEQMNHAEQQELIQFSLRVSLRCQDTVKVYRGWVKPFVQIGAFVLAVVITVKSLGTGAKLGAALLKATISLSVGIAIDKVVDFAVKVGIISPKAANVIKLIVQLTMIAQGAGWDFSKILTAPNIMRAVNLSFDYYNKKKAWELQEVQKQQDEHNRMHQSRMEALAAKQKMADLGVASDPSLYLNMPSFVPSVNLFETPEMMYARHYNFNVVNLSLGSISNLADGLKYRQVDRVQQVRDITQEIEDVLLIT